MTLTPEQRAELDALHGRITDGMERTDTADYAQITSNAFMMMTMTPDDVTGFLEAWPAVSAHIAALEAALSRQADNMAFVLNNMAVPDQWYQKFTDELAADRATLGGTNDAN